MSEPSRRAVAFVVAALSVGRAISLQAQIKAEMKYAQVYDISLARYTLSQGARAALEMRSDDVPFTLEDGQMIGRLVYETLTDAAERVYGQGIGSDDQRQGLKLSEHLKPFDLNQC